MPLTKVPLSQVDNTSPAFSAFINTGSQSLTNNTFNKVLCQGEKFDTNGNYDNATNYRFQPTVPGYYQIDAAAALSGSLTQGLATIYKNGTEFKRGSVSTVTSAVTYMGVNVSALVFMNGSTDYLEFYVYPAGTGLTITGGAANAYFQGFLARSA